MALTVGTPAPDFTLTTLGAEGPELFKLSEKIGQQNLLLLFVPMAFTGVCTRSSARSPRASTTTKHSTLTVIGISGDNPFAQKAWAEKEGITLKLLSDYDHHVAESLRRRLRGLPPRQEPHHGRRAQALCLHRGQGRCHPVRRVQRLPRRPAELRRHQGQARRARLIRHERELNNDLPSQRAAPPGAARFF
jgi:peroxiredoxin